MRFPKSLHFIQMIAGVSLLVCSVSARAQDANNAAASPAVSSGTQPLVDAPDAPRTPDTTEDQGKNANGPNAQTGTVSGTVTDTYGDVVPGATVALEGASPADRQSTTANDTGFFKFDGLKPGVTYVVKISAPNFDNWISPTISIAPGQYFDLVGIKLRLANAETSVTVLASTEQIATQQVHIEEEQRVLGFIPNFYVVYDAKDAVPMTTKLKFQMALRVSVDPVSFAGAVFLGAVNQAADTPDYRQGWLGYGQRVGAVYADGFTDIMFGGAILPSLLHQDPRYFYQGTGTVKSRLRHAMSNPFIARGDNGKLQPNFSSIGGDLISASISNAYYPQSNRGLGLTFENLGIDTAERVASSIIQEFVIRKLTPSANRHN